MKMTEYEHGVPSWIDLAHHRRRQREGLLGGLFGWDSNTTENPAFGAYTMFEVNGLPVVGGMAVMAPGQPAAWTSYLAVDDADQAAEAVAANGGGVLVAPMEVVDVRPDGRLLRPGQGAGHALLERADDPGPGGLQGLLPGGVVCAGAMLPALNAVP